MLYLNCVVLLLKDEQGHLQPYAYYSKVLQSNQTHYPAYQQELLGIVLAIQEWRHYIEGAKKITCITDHATLRHLVSTENVNALTARRFALWSDIIAPYIGMNDETLVVRASCPLNMYLITPGSAVFLVCQLYQMT